MLAKYGIRFRKSKSRLALGEASTTHKTVRNATPNRESTNSHVPKTSPADYPEIPNAKHPSTARPKTYYLPKQPKPPL